MKLKNRKRDFNFKFFKLIFSKKKLFFLSICLMIFLVVFYSIKSDFFAIKKINILSGDLLCSQNSQIKSALNFFGKSILFVDLKKGEETLKDKFLCVKSIEFSKLIPDTLEVKVINRKAEIILIPLKEEFASDSAVEKLIDIPASQSAEILDGLEKFVVDSEGVIFSKNIDENLNKVYISSDLSLGKKIDENLIKNLLKIFERLKTFGINNYDQVIQKDELILISSYPRIIFRLNSEIEKQLAALQLILKKAKIDDETLEFIDLRFDKPVVRYGKGQSNLRN